ncbi:MAG: hypothetical protein GY869_22600, partial [Planctomycetes bacterium]|nr:hypothetical protein [Planctomycetota bacterium]
IPSSLGQLTELVGIILNNNDLDGLIPDLSALEDLQILLLHENQLTGSIPDLRNLLRLRIVQLDNNQLSENIEADYFPPWLQVLWLHNNRLSGSIPDLSHLGQSYPSLQLRLENNQLSGEIPTSFLDMSLARLELNYNRLTASDPDLIEFIESHSPGWDLTQTVPPTNVQATVISPTSVEISWTPILYTGDGGYYKIFYRLSPEGGLNTNGLWRTVDKNANHFVMDQLETGATYYFYVMSYTPAHDDQQNDLNSTLSSVATATPISFESQSPITTEAIEAMSVDAADIDGDGDPDLISASYGDNTIAWHENTDDVRATWLQHEICTTADGAQSIHAADLDGDGDPDVLSASFENDKIAWYQNTNGQGDFGSPQDIATADGAMSVFAIDLDGDNDLDVLSASQNDDKIAWYENTDGQGNFGPPQVITTTADGAMSVYAADLDGDGDSDIISASFEDDKIAWYENTNGLGNFGAPQEISAMADGAMSVYATDVDGDGDLDVLSASQNDNKIAWYEKSGGTRCSWLEHEISIDAVGAKAVYAADMDNDGDSDVLS